MAFPVTRLRRLRRTAELRNLVAETRLTPDAFVYPLFVCPGEGVRREVRSMPGVFNLSVDEAVKEAEEAARLGCNNRPAGRRGCGPAPRSDRGAARSRSALRAR